MRLALNLLGRLVTLGWTALAADYFAGARRMKAVESLPPFAAGEDVPALSVVVAACNEEEKLPGAFRTLLAQEYPGPFEVVAVDDRSTDGTAALLDEMAREGAERGVRVVVLHLDRLPPGWLGKTHALFRGARRASGDWLLFTDADIHFAPTALSRTVRHAQAERLDHLASFMRLDLRGFWENVFGLTFGTLFTLRFRPWRVRDPRTANYLGIGGFNLVRRDAYEAVGTHRALALEVADDMELGRRVKAAGFASDVVGAGAMISVRWQEGLSGLLRGLEKNAYAGLNYSPVTLLTSVGFLLGTVLSPALGLLFARDPALRRRCAVSVACFVSVAAHQARNGGIPVGYALTLPFSCLLLVYVMFRSAWLTETNGGITWRGTFYPLADLRGSAVPPPPPDDAAPS